jgi:hypothetical protein
MSVTGISLGGYQPLSNICASNSAKSMLAGQPTIERNTRHVSSLSLRVVAERRRELRKTFED